MSLDFIDRPSPNHNERKRPVSLLVLHYTDMAELDHALSRLCDPACEVSAHYLIDKQGRIYRLVDESRRAWHAGVSCWQGERDVNSASIGIELDHAGHDANGTMAAFPAAQMAALTALARDIIARHDILPANVLGHSDVAPGRKIDPGEAFDWRALAAAGIGLWPENVPIENVGALRLGDDNPAVNALRQTLAAYGYDIPVTGAFDAPMQAVICAFQRHFRPQKIDGIADAQTRTLIYATCRARG